MPEKSLVEKIIAGVGSVPSLVVHTLAFASCFLISLAGLAEWSTMLLVLTTVIAGYLPSRMIVRRNTLDSILGRN